MLKKSFFVVFVFVFSIVKGVSTAQETVKIGAIFDLSGPTSDAGGPYADGVTAFVDWVNSDGGIEGRIIELVSRDSASDVRTAESLYAQFVRDGVVGIIGWGADDTEALRANVAADQIPFMSASYAAELNDPSGEAPFNFLVGTTYSDQIVIMMRFMLDEWEAAGNSAEDMKIALFYPDDLFGISPLADGEAFAQEHGIETLRIPLSRGIDRTAELTQAANYGATHAIIQDTSLSAALLLRNAEDIGLLDTIQFGCLNWCADEILLDNAKSAAEGVLGALPFGPTTVEAPGQEEPLAWLEVNSDKTLEEATLHFTQGWWTMAVMTEGIRLALQRGNELTGFNIRANLETLTDFDTGEITAPITFTADDHRGNRSLTVFVVEDGVWVQASDPIDLRDNRR